MKSKLQLLSLVAALILMSAGVCNANGLSLTATGLTVTGPASGYDTLRFTISWNNSWYASTPPTNYDAAWVFVKYQDCSANTWNHVHVSGVAGWNYVTGGSSNLQADPVSDSMGVFVHLQNPTATGTVSGVVSLLFNVSNLTGTSPFNFKVFGIEMVEVLTDSFQVGDGTSANAFNQVNIGSEASIGAGVLGGTVNAGGSLPAAYPKGYNREYCMKYEITQHQYCDFLNTLTYNQQASFTTAAPNAIPNTWALSGTDRNGIKIQTSGYSPTLYPAVYGCDGNTNNTFNEAGDGLDVSENFMSWTDLLGYLNWAGLRPMDDLEYEKICRGGPPSIVQRIPGEYVWATGNITQEYSQTANNYGTVSELGATTGVNGTCAIGSPYGTGTANGNYNVEGPMRAGFAATATTTRQTAGASYWGALDMAGNVWEQVVGIYSATSIAFLGTLGNGNATTGPPSDWPTSTANAARRGSSYQGAASYGRTSDRTFYNSGGLGRTYEAGGRGVRQF